jgi:O-antigen ligase
MWPASRQRPVLTWAGAISALLLLGWLLATWPLSRCLALIGGLAGALALLLHPELGLYALAFAVPFGSDYALHLGSLTVGPSEAILAATLLCWGARALAQRRWGGGQMAAGLPLALTVYIAALVLSLLPAHDLLAGVTELTKWVEVLALLLIASQLSARQGRVLVACLLAAGVAEALLGMNQFLRQIGPPGFVLLGRYMRAYGTFAQPNPFGGYLGLLLPLAYAPLLAGWGDAAKGGRRALRWVMTAAVATALLVGLLMSWSRGALLGLAVGAGLVLLALGRRLRWLLLLLAVLLALWWPELAAVAPQGTLERLTDLTGLIGRDLTTVEITDANFANVERLAHWVAGWRMFTRQPWLGVGTGQYATVYPQVAVPRWQEAMGHAHNYYLNVLAESGLVGLAAYLAVVGAALVAAWRGAQRQSGWSRGLGLAALGMVGHLVGHSLVDNLYVHGMYLLVAMVLGLALGRQGRLAEGEWDLV